MTRSDNSMEKLMAEAERLGKEQEALEERNRKRRAKGRQPLPDAQERQDMDVHRRRYRTGDPTTVDAADALKLFELRKAEMANPEDSGHDGAEDDEQETPAAPPPRKKSAKAEKSGEDDEEKARRAAESARRVQDLKNGRIDHEGNWSDKGQTLEGGDGTIVVDKSEVGRIWGDEGQSEDSKSGKPQDAAEKPEEPVEMKGTFLKDLYRRLGVSFEAIERSLSDLQGRVAEIVTATTPNAPTSEDGADEFKAMLAKKTPVVFDVGGTQMTFDAITVFHAPPCITVVSKIGSAKITPKPGAQLLLTYEMDGQRYVQDPVTFLGTRFDLPMFGLSFVGFIRDREADMIDTAAGISEAEAQPSAGGAE